MQGDDTTINVETIEALTLHSLERSIAGLDELAGESRECASVLRESLVDGFCKFGELAEKMDGFGKFHGDVMSLFKIDPATIRDGHGDLESVESSFRSIQERMLQHLERRQTADLAALLETELPQTLARFIQLIPSLSAFIRREYVQTGSDSRPRKRGKK